LQCVAVCCSVLQCVAVCCSVLQCSQKVIRLLLYGIIYVFSHPTHLQLGELKAAQVCVGCRKVVFLLLHGVVYTSSPYTCTLQQTATHCNTLQHTATHYNTPYICVTWALLSDLHTPYTLQYTAPRCATLLRTATHCNTLQHTATHCNTPYTPRVSCCMV